MKVTKELYDKSILHKNNIQTLKDIKKIEEEILHAIDEHIEKSLQDKVSLGGLHLRSLYDKDKVVIQNKISLLEKLILLWDTELYDWDQWFIRRYEYWLK